MLVKSLEKSTVHRYSYTWEITGSPTILSDVAGIVKPECYMFSQRQVLQQNVILQNIHRTELLLACCIYWGHPATLATAFDFCRKTASRWLFTRESFIVHLNDHNFCYYTSSKTQVQSDWSFTHQQFRCLVLSPFESCHMIDIMLPRKPNICHVRDTMLPCKPNICHASFRKVILRRVLF